MPQMKLLVVFLMSSCATCKRPYVARPSVVIYTHDKNLGLAFGADSFGVPRMPVPIADTDKWIMLDPASYTNLKKYIDDLKASY